MDLLSAYVVALCVSFPQLSRSNLDQGAFPGGQGAFFPSRVAASSATFPCLVHNRNRVARGIDTSTKAFRRLAPSEIPKSERGSSRTPLNFAQHVSFDGDVMDVLEAG